MEKLNIFYLSEVSKDSIDYLTIILNTKVDFGFGEEINPECKPDILISGLPPENIFEIHPSIKSLIIPWAGLPRATRNLVIKNPQLKVYNIHHNADIVAEHTLALLLSSARDICNINRNLKNHDWSDRYNEPTLTTLKNKTITILGYGTIGEKIGKICSALGMNVIGVKKYIKKQADNIYSLKDLNKLLPQSDVLIIALPVTDETKELIGAKELSLIPDNAILINIGRGMIINEEALYHELKLGRIRAGLDVWYNYPKSETEYSYCLPSKFNFHELKNVVMTPHLAGHAMETEKLRNDALIDLINNIINNNADGNLVDIEAGY